MKEYLCIKDFYVEDIKYASVGDHVVLLPDNTTSVNTNGQRVASNILTEDNIKKYFKLVYTNKKQTEINEEDNVNHPSHYTWLKEKCGIEVIDITRHMDFNLGNAIKYILRAGHKSEDGYSNVDKTIEDLQKAIFYLNDEIELIRKTKKLD